ncbi:MAG: 30S ribosomal protein S6 [Deltaproteobacteria bacterium]|nr:30S ribosomal protein S6 [Candidatus Zymogenaceae bacterium]
MRTYETIFILDPDLSDEDTEKSLAKIQDIITSQNGTIALTERWGKRKLAYRVRKKTKGNYFRLVYYAEGSLIAPLERILRITEEVYKFITVKLADKEMDIASLVTSDEEESKDEEKRSTPRRGPLKRDRDDNDEDKDKNDEDNDDKDEKEDVGDDDEKEDVGDDD